jgi:Gram-negative bacterial TonB protein C-terminal
MNNQRVSVALIFTVGIFAGLACSSACGSVQSLASFCGALQTVEPGDRIPVCLTGIYLVGPEHQLFYDPKQPSCEANIQPSTWVEFGPGEPHNEVLERLLKQSGRAFVTLLGELYGPGPAGPDDSSLAPNVALANRVEGRRYGHLNAFRTKLVVDKILSVAPVPTSQPWDAVWADPTGAQRLAVLAARVPWYPALARRAGISGAVVAEVLVKDGQVVSVDMKSGDRALIAGTVANIDTWRFEPGTNATFTTTFVYQLERRAAGDEGPRIELHLPDSVTVTAASYDW